MTNERIGRFIASLRREAGLTQEQLAERLGISNRSVSRWENGKTLPDLSLMQLLCQEFNVSISELLNGKRNPSVDNERTHARLLLEYADRKLQENSRQLSRYFISGFCFLLLAFFAVQSPLPLFSRSGIPQIAAAYIFLGFSLIFGGAGFYKSRTGTMLTQSQLDVMLQPEDCLMMSTGEEMLQYARKYQKNAKKQHLLAFDKIAEGLAQNEYATFTMIADSYQHKEDPVPWHIALAVTNQRIILCGELLRGCVMTHYITASIDLQDILDVQFLNKKLLIKTTTHPISITGSDLHLHLARLKHALKNAS